jgi:uncharacterized membrane protein (UPF0182 family)
MALSRRGKALMVVGLLFILVTVIPTLVGLFTDWLWFREVGYTVVLSKRLQKKNAQLVFAAVVT